MAENSFPSLKRLRLLLPLLLLLALRQLQAQPAGWEHFGTESGLLSEEVYKVFQDPDGYLWALTDYGPQRHNGKQFELVPGFSASDPPAYNYCLDRQKRLWLYNSRGEIGQYQNGKFRKHPHAEKLASLTARRNSFAFNIREGKSGQLYLESFRNLIRWNTRNRLDTLPNSEENGWTVRRIDGRWLTNRSPVRDSFLKARSTAGLFIPIRIYDFLPQAITVLLPFPGLAKYRFMATEGPQGLLITVGNQAVLVGKTGEVQVKSFPNSIIFNQRIKDQLYIGLFNTGLARLDHDLEHLTYILPGVSVSDVHADDEGQLWVSTLENGVFRQKEAGLEFVPAIPGRASMLCPGDSFLLAGTENGELYRILPNGSVQTLPLPGLRSSKIFDFTRNGDGFLVGTHSGVFSWDGDRRFELIMESKTGYNTVGQHFCRLPDGRLLLSHIRGILEFEPSGLRMVHTFPFKVKEIVFWENRLWLATDEGIKAYQMLGNQLHLRATYFQGIRILRMMVAEGKLWFSAPGKGICSLSANGKPEKLAELPLQEPALDFCFPAPDEMLIASLSGVQWRNSHTGQARIISSMPTLRLACWQNRLWLGTKNGLMVHRWPMAEKRSPLPFYLRSLEENGTRQTFKPGMKLQAENQSLSFRFDVLAYGKQGSGLLYELSGPGLWKGKTESGQLAFSRLPPGNYELQVRAWATGQETGTAPLTFRFSIQPAFYETWWFQLAAGLLTLLAIGIGIRLILRYYRRQYMEANRLQQRLAGSKITALQSQMNPHFVSNALTAIQNLILTGQLEEAIGYIAKFSRMLRMVLELSGKPFVSLEKELQVIRYNVGLEQLRFRQQFEFSLFVAEDISTQDLFVPTLITQPFVENAIWHGLLPLEDQRKARLSISIRKEDDRLLLEIEDNGVGRNREVEKRRDQPSFGQQLTISRFDNLNKLLGRPLCELTIEDLHNQTTGETGTRIRLKLPSNFHEIKDQSLFT